MSESPTPPSTICRVDPCNHAQLVAQVRRLTCSDGLMAQTIKHVKASNELAQHNNWWIRVVLILFIGALVLIIAVFGLALTTLRDMARLERQLHDTTLKLDAMASEVSHVKESTDKADEEREGQTRVELVPEGDPAKAAEAPIKVRISSPASPTGKEHPDAANAAVEVPLPVKDVVVTVPKDSGDRR